ncbi:MAG: PfkB family carbohydrate kinase, partial [Herbinix sp.]|nr:PfkB family carbohydrate kinase [Herbinix sp.]
LNNVDYSMSVRMHGETGRCTCELIDGDRILGDENDGGLVKSDPLVISDDIIEYIKTFDVVHVSCYSYIDDQLYKVKEAGIPLLYDFSTAWEEEKVEKIGKVADFILFSQKDDLTEEENYKMFIDAVDKYHCKVSVMTMGIKGAWVYDGKQVYKKMPYNVEGGAIDTTGCGDSWISGFITTYIEAMKRLNLMITSSDDCFILRENAEDTKKHAIELSMCIANLRARNTCRIKGAYGHGIPIESYTGEVKK